MSPAYRMIAAAAITLASCQWLLADSGKVQFRREIAPYQITIFTSPTPLRAGPVDLSVLVQDAAGNVVNDAEVDFRLKGESGAILTPPASQAAATNKLLQSAKFVLPEAGVWQVHARIAAESTVDMEFEIRAQTARSDWGTAAWMLLLPIAFVTLFVVRERLVHRQRSE